MVNTQRELDNLPQYAGTITGGEGVDIDFSSMSRQKLNLIDVNSLTFLQKQQMIIRLGEL